MDSSIVLLDSDGGGDTVNIGEPTTTNHWSDSDSNESTSYQNNRTGFGVYAMMKELLSLVTALLTNGEEPIEQILSSIEAEATLLRSKFVGDENVAVAAAACVEIEQPKKKLVDVAIQTNPATAVEEKKEDDADADAQLPIAPADTESVILNNVDFFQKVIQSLPNM